MRLSRWLLLFCLGAVLALAACGGDDDANNAKSGASDTAAASAEGTSAEETPAEETPSVEAPPTEPPAAIQVDEALPKTPPAGKKVIFLQCEIPSCARYTPAMKRATDALGWKFNSQVFKNNAEGPAGAMDQAIAQKPDYIAITGIPAAALKPQLKKAADAGILVVSGSVPEQPSKSGWLAQIGGTLQPDAENITKWMVQDSGGKADVVAVTIPQFPSLNTQTDWMKSDLKTMCPGCKYDQLDVTVEELGAGGVPQKLVGYLQAHPDVNYAFFTFSNLGQGVGKVLKAANLRDKVKLTGCCGDSVNAQEIVAGQTDAWTISPNEYSGYAMIDAMARQSVGMDLTKSNQEVYQSPSWVVASPDAVNTFLKPTKFDWYGPTDFEQQFQQLWKGKA